MLLKKSLLVGVLFSAPVFAALPVKYDVIDLGTFCSTAQPTAPCGTYAYAFGNNDQGVVVGNGQGALLTNTDNTQTREFSFHPFAWSTATTPDLQDLGDFGKDAAYAEKINDSGLIVGHASKVISVTEAGVETIQTRAFKTTVGNALTALPVPATETSSMKANDVSNADHIVGTVVTKSNPETPDTNLTHGFLLLSNATEPLLMKGLDATRTTELLAISSEANLAVGYSVLETKVSALAYRLDAPETAITLTDLGGNSSFAYGVNSAGLIAGRSLNAEKTKFNAVVMRVNGAVTDLGQLNENFSNSVAYAINDSGVVVGQAQSEVSSGRNAAFVYDLNASSPKMINVNTLIDCAADSNERWDISVARAINTQGEIVGSATKGGEVRAVLLRPSADTTAPVQCAPLEPPFEDKNSAGSVPVVFFGVLLGLWFLRRKQK